MLNYWQESDRFQSGDAMNEKLDEFDIQCLKAKARVQQMDRSDGFKDRYLPTIFAALECGLKHPDTGAQFDALFMLSDLIKDERDAASRSEGKAGA